MIRNGLRVRAKTEPSNTTTGAASESPIDAELVRQLAQMVEDTGLAEIEIEKGDLRIRLTRHHNVATYHAAPAAPPAPAAALMPAAAVAPVTPPAATIDADNAGLVKSPMVGTVYRRQNPESKPFVEVGSAVKVGDRVLLVEAMKTFNDIVAHKTGTIAAVMVEDGQPVEYGEPLLLIE